MSVAEKGGTRPSSELGRVWSRVREMADLGLTFGKIYAAFAVIVLLIRLPAVGWDGVPMLLLAPLLYVGGGTLAGAIVGLLFPLTRWVIGRIITGIIAAFPVALGGALLVLSEQEWALLPRLTAWSAVVLGVIGALAMSIVYRDR
jgi:hypothetical protein